MISIDDIKICKCVYGVWIYSVNIDEWVFKIGYTSNFYNRFEKLFNEHCKEEIHEGVIQRKILQKIYKWQKVKSKNHQFIQNMIKNHCMNII